MDSDGSMPCQEELLHSHITPGHACASIEPSFVNILAVVHMDKSRNSLVISDRYNTMLASKRFPFLGRSCPEQPKRDDLQMRTELMLTIFDEVRLQFYHVILLIVGYILRYIECYTRCCDFLKLYNVVYFYIRLYVWVNLYSLFIEQKCSYYFWYTVSRHYVIHDIMLTHILYVMACLVML